MTGKHGRRKSSVLVSVESHPLTIKRYANLITEMVDTMGVSKSQVWRTMIDAGAEVLKALAEITFHDIELLAVWIDVIQLGQCHVVCAAGVDPEGNKQDLLFLEGDTLIVEDLESLLEDMVSCRLDPPNWPSACHIRGPFTMTPKAKRTSSGTKLTMMTAALAGTPSRPIAKLASRPNAHADSVPATWNQPIPKPARAMRLTEYSHTGSDHLI